MILLEVRSRHLMDEECASSEYCSSSVYILTKTQSVDVCPSNTSTIVLSVSTEMILVLAIIWNLMLAWWAAATLPAPLVQYIVSHPLTHKPIARAGQHSSTELNRCRDRGASCVLSRLHPFTQTGPLGTNHMSEITSPIPQAAKLDYSSPLAVGQHPRGKSI